jgi:hypothetical protein
MFKKFNLSLFKKIFAQLLLIGFLFIPKFVQANDFDISNEFESFDSVDDLDNFDDFFSELALLNQIENPDADTNLEDIDFNIPEFETTNDSNSLLTRGMVDGLSLWGRTGGSRTRDTLHLIPNRQSTTDKSGFVCNFFFNRASNVNINPSISLSSAATDLLNQFLDYDDAEVGEEDFGTMMKVLPYVLKMSVQEHRAGAFLQYVFQRDNWVGLLESALLMSQRNYWVGSKQDRADLQNILEDLEGLSGASLYKVKYGLSDTRFKFGYKAVDKKNAKLNIGASVTVPTSRIFDNRKPTYTRNVKVGDDRTALVNSLLKTGEQIMITPKLGAGAWGLGTFIDSSITTLNGKLDFFGRLSWDYLFPFSDYRFMPSNRNVSFADLLSITSDDGITSEFPLDDVFPHLVKAWVTPGSIFNAIIGTNLNLGKWSFNLGYDFYLQQSETIRKINAYDTDCSLLSIDSALARQVTQHKLFTGVSYKKKCRKFDLLLGLGGDITVASTNAPKDWTVSCKLGFKF